MILDQYLVQLQTNTQRVVNLLQSITEEVANKKVNNSWHTIEIVEHILLVERAVILGLRKKQVPIETETIYGNAKLEKIIVQLREKKTAAPTNFIPIGKNTTIETATLDFIASRNTFLQYLIDGTIVIDNSMYPHPYLGNMSKEDWCYFLLHHTERHCLQIQDIIEA